MPLKVPAIKAAVLFSVFIFMAIAQACDWGTEAIFGRTVYVIAWIPIVIIGMAAFHYWADMMERAILGDEYEGSRHVDWPF